jgi:hypothetical protein
MLLITIVADIQRRPVPVTPHEVQLHLQTPDG